MVAGVAPPVLAMAAAHAFGGVGEGDDGELDVARQHPAVGGHLHLARLQLSGVKVCRVDGSTLVLVGSDFGDDSAGGFAFDGKSGGGGDLAEHGDLPGDGGFVGGDRVFAAGGCGECGEDEN